MPSLLFIFVMLIVAILNSQFHWWVVDNASLAVMVIAVMAYTALTSTYQESKIKSLIETHRLTIETMVPIAQFVMNIKTIYEGSRPGQPSNIQ